MRPLALLIAGLWLCAAPAAAQVEVGFGGTPHDSSLPIEILSDSLRMEQETGLAIFSGNVLAVQGDLRIAAQEIRVTYSPEIAGQSRNVTEVLATGGVTINRGAEAAEGARARYVVAENLLELAGNVLVTQSSGAIAGQRLVIDVATGRGVVEGRVRTTLQNQGG